MGQELVQGRIQGSDGHRPSGHGAEDAGEVGTLHRQDRGQRLAAPLGIRSHDHPPHGVDAVVLEEHVLRAGQADALGAQGDCLQTLLRGVGVGPDAQASMRVGPGEHPLVACGDAAGLGHAAPADQRLHDLRGPRYHLAHEHPAGGSVQAEPVTLGQFAARGGQPGRFIIDGQCRAAYHAGLAALAGHQGGVAGHAAAAGEDAARHLHAPYILRRGLHAHEDDRLPTGGPGFGVIGMKHHAPGGRTRTGREAGGQEAPFSLGHPQFGYVEDGGQEMFHGLGLDAPQGRPVVDQAFIHHVRSDADGRQSRALAGAGLQHPQLAPLHGELQILHVVKVALQARRQVYELAVGVRHGLFQGDPRPLGDLADGLRGAGTGHHVLALGIRQELAKEAPLAAGRVAGEGHAGGAISAEVAEDHCLHIDRCAPVGRDMVHTAVFQRPRVVPTAKHRTDGSPQLRTGIFRKRRSRAPADQVQVGEA